MIKISTPIILKANGVEIPAILNDTIAAQEFKKKLPYTVSGYRAEFDYCCCAKSGAYDVNEVQAGWKNGDISFGDGWFSVLFDGEEQSKHSTNMMIIAHIDEADLHWVKSLPENVTFTVDLA